jgi:hypothetical protein
MKATVLLNAARPVSHARVVTTESVICSSMSFTERQACAVSLLAPFADDSQTTWAIKARAVRLVC